MSIQRLLMTSICIISHLLSQIPYKEAPREKVKLPKRQKPGDYVDPKYPFKYIEQKF